MAQSHWETIVKTNANWNYFIGESEPPANWYAQGFDDSSWSVAKGSFGYGDNDDTTIVNIAHSLYIRNEFTINDKSIIDSLVLDIDYDDAFVAYLNGSVIARSFNLETDFPTYDQSLSTGHNAVMFLGNAPTRVALPMKYLLDGDNVLAIQGINVNTTSSDFSLAPFIHGKVNAAGIVYNEVPEWFLDPDAVFESNLPILVIETENGQSIPDEPKIKAHMGIINSTSGINEYPGSYTNYDGQIGIELRGQSSMGFDKKGYGIETRLANGENNNVSLLGLPEENDWVLHGPYSDKSLMRNVLSYQFAREMGQYAPRTRYCELFLNNTYYGVYVLTEKIKRDSLRVDIGKLTPDEVADRDLTGGYIFKLDKGDEDGWTSPYMSTNNYDINFLYNYPDPTEMPEAQKDYISNFVTNFEDALAGDNFFDPVLGYKSYIDMQSFVDYYLMNELSKNVDAYRISSYFHKDKDKKDKVSPIKAGPVWDYNLAFGNADYHDASTIPGWRSDHPGDGFATPFWWNKLKEDPEYYNLMVDSWTKYRNTILSNERVNDVIDSITTLLEGAQERNFNAFPILDSWIWPNNYVGSTYENEISYLKTWILDRMLWMDNSLDEYMDPLITSPIATIGAEFSNLNVQIFPNPIISEFNVHLSIDLASEVSVEIYNVLGQKIHQSDYTLPNGLQTLRFDEEMVNKTMSQSGTYYLSVHIDGNFAGVKMLVKK